MDSVDTYGWTALHCACAHNELDIVKYLAINNANIHIPDSNGNRAITWARYFGSYEAYKYLTNVIKLQIKRETALQIAQQNSNYQALAMIDTKDEIDIQ